MVKCQSIDLASYYGSEEPSLCISTSKRDIFSVGCWIPSSSKTLEGMQEDLTTALMRIESQLSKDGFYWANVLYIHLYISDMKQFALANEVYARLITEKKCHLGVPSRSTIELPLMQAGLGNAYIEVLVANDQCKRVLHVQSISSWAPSCIGPYSQATLRKEVLYMAGQLGLDPPTMTLCSGGAVAETELALENCEAVAQCFKSSLTTSAIIFVIYCSASLASCEKTEIQNTIDHFLRQRAFNLHKASFLSASNPVFLYVLAPSLPKGALVEIKPVLHVPENGDDEANSTVPPTACTEAPTYWGFEYSDLHDHCCQAYNIHGKICTALVSITKDTAASICSEAVPSVASFLYYGSDGHMKSILKFCIYLLDKILSDNCFAWADLMHLRLYFSVDLSVAADMLSLIVSGVLTEFGEMTGRIEMGKEPIFSLVPVLGSGRSASMDDMITWELFATKS